MKGIQFVVDDAGEKRAVLLDLAEWGDLWEDFYDIMVARTRQDEEELSWQELKQENVAFLNSRCHDEKYRY